MARKESKKMPMEAKNFREALRAVRAFAFDVDGVLTNSRVLINERGELLRNANTRDGYALHQAALAGYPIAIITGGFQEGVGHRYAALGITDVYLGAYDKVEALKDFCKKRMVSAESILYMGDDLPDYEVMQRVGMPVCPLDASSDILNISRYVSPYAGGEGCVRDVVEQVMRLQEKWRVGGEEGAD